MDSSSTGSLTTYFSLAQLPRSSRRQRSLQNGNSASVAESVGFRQIGQWCLTRRAYRKAYKGAASLRSRVLGQLPQWAFAAK